MERNYSTPGPTQGIQASAFIRATADCHSLGLLNTQQSMYSVHATNRTSSPLVAWCCFQFFCVFFFWIYSKLGCVSKVEHEGTAVAGFTGQMPILSPNKHHQGTEEKSSNNTWKKSTTVNKIYTKCAEI